MLSSPSFTIFFPKQKNMDKGEFRRERSQMSLLHVFLVCVWSSCSSWSLVKRPKRENRELINETLLIRLMELSLPLLVPLLGPNPICSNGLTSSGFMTSPSKELALLMAKALAGGISLKPNTALRSAFQTSHFDYILQHMYIYCLNGLFYLRKISYNRL